MKVKSWYLESLVKIQTKVDTARKSVELSRKRKACRAVTR